MLLPCLNFLRQLFFFRNKKRRCSFQAPLDRNDALAEMEFDLFKRRVEV